MPAEKAPKSTGHNLKAFFKKGEQYFVETATKYYTGTLADIDGNAILLEKAAWVPDTGRFNTFMAGGKPSEMEPCGDAPVLISLGAIVTVMPRKITIEVL